MLVLFNLWTSVCLLRKLKTVSDDYSFIVLFHFVKVGDKNKFLRL